MHVSHDPGARCFVPTAELDQIERAAQEATQ
jgi:hypothetical protein